MAAIRSCHTALNRGSCAIRSNAPKLRASVDNVAGAKKFYDTDLSVDANIKVGEARTAQNLYEDVLGKTIQTKILENNIQIVSDARDALQGILSSISNIIDELGHFAVSELLNIKHAGVLYKTIYTTFGDILLCANRRSAADNAALFSGDYVDRVAIPSSADTLLNIHRTHKVIRLSELYNGSVTARTLAGSSVQLPTASVFQDLINCIAQLLNALDDSRKANVQMTQEMSKSFERRLSEIHSKLSGLSGEMLFDLNKMSTELGSLRTNVASNTDKMKNGMGDTASDIATLSNELMKANTLTSVHGAMADHQRQIINNAMR